MIDVKIEAKSVDEAHALAKTINEDPQVRAFVIVVGALAPLDDDARRRVLNFVWDKWQSEARKSGG